MKKTEWFPASVKPVHKGIYRVVKEFGECWANWNGISWSHGSAGRELTYEAAVRMKQSHRGAYPVKRWRGLAEQPK